MTASSSGTEFLGGGDTLRKFLGKHLSNVTCKVSGSACGPNSISFTASTAGANPMFRVRGIGNLAPDIDTFVDFRAEWSGTGIRFSGVVRGDDFPNVEVFVLDARGVGCLLFDGRTTAGQDTGPMTRLAGDHAFQRLGTFWCAVPLTTANTFRHAKQQCPITQMEAPRKQAAWVGHGGQFDGEGAAGRW